MIAIDTDEKLDWLLNALENEELHFVSRERTKEEWDEISRELAEYRATHPKLSCGQPPPAREAVLA